MGIYRFGKRSNQRLSECHTDLQRLMNHAIASSPFDLTILCGHRNEVDQNEAYRKEHSKLKYPKSKHNKTPSLAVDVAPYPIDWNNIQRFKEMVAHIKESASELDIDVTFGADWNTLKDYPHIQLVIHNV